MKKVYEVTVDGNLCPVTVSDENEALQAAHAAGGAIVGIWKVEEDEAAEMGETVEAARQPVGKPEVKDTSGFDACLYLVTSEADITEWLLERAARRHLDLPWHIAETKRLLIREFSSVDPLEPASEHDGDGVFSDWEKREAYRHSQYRFSECGLWVLVEKATGRLVGKAGLAGGELGYHIYPEYRGRGYAEEACRAVLAYGAEELDLETVMLTVEKSNLPSLALAKKLGFSQKEENMTESYCFLHVQRI